MSFKFRKKSLRDISHLRFLGVNYFVNYIFCIVITIVWTIYYYANSSCNSSRLKTRRCELIPRPVYTAQLRLRFCVTTYGLYEIQWKCLQSTIYRIARMMRNPIEPSICCDEKIAFTIVSCEYPFTADVFSHLLIS